MKRGARKNANFFKSNKGGPNKARGGWKKVEKLINGGNVYLALESTSLSKSLNISHDSGGMGLFTLYIMPLGG